MSRHAANPAALPPLSTKSFRLASTRQDAHESESKMASLSVAFGRVRRSAIRSNIRAENADGAFGPEGLNHFVSRPLLGHGFGAYPAPCGTASFCFGCAALRVMVPP